MSKAKAMGTAVETAAVRWLTQNGFPLAERLPLCGSADQGDIRLQRAPTIIAECKRAMRGLQLTPWMRELSVEINNAGAAYGLLIAKQRGAGDKRVHRWAAAMHYPAWQTLLNSCPPRETPIFNYAPSQIGAKYIAQIAEDRSSEYRLTGPTMPFGITYTPGTTDIHHQVVVGPLEQFIELLRAAGYGKDTSDLPNA